MEEIPHKFGVVFVEGSVFYLLIQCYVAIELFNFFLSLTGLSECFMMTCGWDDAELETYKNRETKEEILVGRSVAS